MYKYIPKSLNTQPEISFLKPNSERNNQIPSSDKQIPRADNDNNVKVLLLLSALGIWLSALGIWLLRSEFSRLRSKFGYMIFTAACTLKT